jgi:predicted dehydrogenase
MKKARVGLIGLGFGSEFIPIYQAHPKAEVAAICQRTKSRVDEVGGRFGIATRYTDFREVLTDPNVDFVHINSPIPEHAPQTIAALKAGKHVMCTVPMATRLDEAREIVALVRETGLK